MTIEHALIGAAIISNGGTLAESPVKPNEFHEYALQNLWETILKQAQENKSCDALTLVSLLPKQAELIYDCVDACYSVDLAPVHAAEVKNKALARRVKDLGHQLIERKDTAQELIDYAFFSGQHHLLPGLIDLQIERLAHLDNTRSGN